MNEDIIVHLIKNNGQCNDELVSRHPIDEVIVSSFIFHIIRHYNETKGIIEYEIECDTSVQGETEDTRSGIFYFWYGNNDISFAYALDFPKMNEDELHKIVQTIKKKLQCLL